MAKTKETNSVKFELSNGTHVELRKGTGADVLKARKNASDDESVMIYLAAQLGTFNGEKLPAEELINLPMEDFILIETKLREIFSKNFQQQEMS